MSTDKSILITGGAGFVGSSLAISLKKKYPHYKLIAFDNLKRRGSELNLPRLAEAGVQFVHGDIRQKADFDSLPTQIDTIIEASAEPSVLAGLNGTPDYLVDTNLNGTINCLYFAKKTGADFIFLSTSRVYPIENIEKSFFEEAETRFVLQDKQSLPGISAKGIAEDFPLGGYRSLYGATKLASELMIQEFQHFYGIRTVINRCGVLTGPWQMGKVDQGVVVLWMARHFWQGKLGYFGYGGQGKQVRDMLHTDDLFGLIDWQIHHLDQINGEVFNVGGGVESSASLQELTHICEEITGSRIEIQQVPENRVADIRIYLTDNSKVSTATGWTPQKRVPEIMQEIYVWMKHHQEILRKILA